MQITARGLLLLLLAAPLLAAATWLPALQYVAGAYLIFCLVLFAADWRLARPIDRFDIRRQHDDRLSLGADNQIRLMVHNRDRRPVTFQIRDEPPDAFGVTKRILPGAADGQRAWRGSYHVRPLRRGHYEFGNVNLRWTGPLGFVLRHGRVPAVKAVKVYPNLLDVRRYDLMLRQNRLQEIGLRHTRLPGHGTEFERLRDYRPDDEYRRINWKATARRHRPITIEYQTERSQNIIVAIDTGRMMQSPVEEVAKLDYALNAALLLAYVAGGMGDKVGMLTFADDVQHFLKPRQGREQFYRMLERLYAVQAQPVEPDYGRALAYLARKQRRRALILIFTDLSTGAGTESLLKHVRLLARQSLPLVVTIGDPEVVRISRVIPEHSLDVYRRAAALQLLHERQTLLERLERQGVNTLDVPANQLSISVVNRYLELKRQLRL